MSWTEIHHPNADALAATCASRIDDLLDLAQRVRGRAVLAMAGGRTAPPICRRLASQPRDWSTVTVLPTDERWVAADHADNNLRQLREGFAAAPGLHWLALVPDLPAGAADAEFAEQTLAPYSQPFDVCLLGMGVDGHFASLFPGAPNLREALATNQVQAAVAIEPDPIPSAGPYSRVSLSLSRILNSRRLLLAITGAEKRSVLERARAGDTTLPVAALLAAAHPAAEIHWSP